MLTFNHWTLGGSTTARWCLVVWYPPEATPCEPVTAPTQPWIPLHAQIDEMVRSTPWETPPNLELLHLEFTPSADGKAILTGGLSPIKDFGKWSGLRMTALPPSMVADSSPGGTGNDVGCTNLVLHSVWAVVGGSGSVGTASNLASGKKILELGTN